MVTNCVRGEPPGNVTVSGEKIKSIAITAYPESIDNASVPVSPCGDCRQVMAEYEQRYGQKIRLIMAVNNN